MLRAVRLDKTADLSVVSVAADVVVDLLPQRSPSLHGPFQSKFLAALDCPIEGVPNHCLRVRELLAPASNFPNAFVGLPPDLLEVLEQLPFERKAGLMDGQAADARLVEHTSDFAIEIELKLLGRRVADAHRLRSLEAGQPRQLHLRELTLAGQAVHDLHLRRAAGDGAQQPVLPRGGFVEVARAHQYPQT